MRYISLFSGIEAASVAWEPLGWEPVAFSEIEPYCCELLKQRFPNVPNLGDITKIDWKEVNDTYGTIDIVVGGSPCQSFSVAGKREGLRGQSGLMYEYIRAVSVLRPRWFIWENVPGALSVEGGAAFRQLLQEMDVLGYGLAWRVLDSQFFNVAQRRERVFLVGSLGDMCCAEVLFDEEGLRRNYQTGRAKRAAITADLEKGPDRIHGYTLKLRHTGTANVGGGSGPLVQTDVSATIATSQDQILITMTSLESHAKIDDGFGTIGTLTRRMYKDPPVACMQTGDDYTSALRARADGSPCVDNGQPVVVIDRAAYNQGINAQYSPHIEVTDCMDTLVSRGPHAVMYQTEEPLL